MYTSFLWATYAVRMMLEDLQVFHKAGSTQATHPPLRETLPPSPEFPPLSPPFIPPPAHPRQIHHHLHILHPKAQPEEHFLFYPGGECPESQIDS